MPRQARLPPSVTPTTRGPIRRESRPRSLRKPEAPVECSAMVDGGASAGSSVRIPRWLEQSTAIAWRLLVLAATIYVAALMLDRLLVVVVPIVVAAMLTTVLAPPARWLRNHG